MYTWFLYSSLCKKSYFRTSALIKHLFLWQKTFSPPAMYQTICNIEGEPQQTRPAGACFFMVALQLDPRHAVLHKGQWFSTSDNIYCIFKDWWMLLLSSKCISLFGATWSTRLGQKKQFATAENSYNIHNLVRNQVITAFFSALCFWFVFLFGPVFVCVCVFWCCLFCF